MQDQTKYPTYNQVMQLGTSTDMTDRQNTKWAKEIAGKCNHEWEPVSFRFESQLLDKDGRVVVRQPDIVSGRVYCVCMKCCSHTYLETGYIGYYLNSPDLLEEESTASEIIERIREDMSNLDKLDDNTISRVIVGNDTLGFIEGDEILIFAKSDNLIEFDTSGILGFSIFGNPSLINENVIIKSEGVGMTKLGLSKLGIEYSDFTYSKELFERFGAKIVEMEKDEKLGNESKAHMLKKYDNEFYTFSSFGMEVGFTDAKILNDGHLLLFYKHTINDKDNPLNGKTFETQVGAFQCLRLNKLEIGYKHIKRNREKLSDKA